MGNSAVTGVSKKQAFLATVPTRLRGKFFNLFLCEVRRGVADPFDIVNRVVDVLDKRYKTLKQGPRYDARVMLEAIYKNAELSIGCAHAAIEHERRATRGVTSHGG